MATDFKLLTCLQNPLCIVAPILALLVGFLFDLIALIANDPTWALMSFYLTAPAAVAGFIVTAYGLHDSFRAQAGSRTRMASVVLGSIYGVIVLSFTVSWITRWHTPAVPDELSLIFAFTGLCVALLTACKSGDFVDGYGDGEPMRGPEALSADATRNSYCCPPTRTAADLLRS